MNHTNQKGPAAYPRGVFVFTRANRRSGFSAKTFQADSALLVPPASAVRLIITPGAVMRTVAPCENPHNRLRRAHHGSRIRSCLWRSDVKEADTADWSSGTALISKLLHARVYIARKAFLRNANLIHLPLSSRFVSRILSPAWPTHRRRFVTQH